MTLRATSPDSGRDATHEVIFGLPSKITEVDAVRGGLIMLSLQSITELGHRERYMKLLDPAYRDRVLNTVASSWVPMDVASAHYGACEAAGFSTAETVAIAEAVCRRMQGTYVETLARTARAVGATAWNTLGRGELLWKRLMQGGGVGLTQVGPKDGLAEIAGLPLCRYTYFRFAFTSTLRTIIFISGARAATVRIHSWDPKNLRVVYRCSWV